MTILGLFLRLAPQPARLALCAALCCGSVPAVGAPPAAAGQPGQHNRAVNDGQLLLEDIPPIPPGLAASLDRYQSTRPSEFVGFSLDSRALYIRSLHGGVEQLQRLDRPGADPRTLTVFDEPVREVRRQYNGELLALTLDQGGSGFEQIYLLDPATGATRLLTDGRSLNNRMVWDYTGRRLAWRSTRRNGSSNDIWLMDVNAPGQARLVWAAPDQALWKPVSFSRDGRLLLVQQYRDITDSRIHLLELDSGRLRELVGLAGQESSNIAIGFDADQAGVFFVSNKRGRAAEIGWAPLQPDAPRVYARDSIDWDVTRFELSPDGRRGAFVTNEDGINRVYLFNPERFSWRPLTGVPIGVISDLRFSPDGRKLGMTISTPTAPAAAHVLKLGLFNSSRGSARAWTKALPDSLEADRLVVPRLFRYPAPGLDPDRPLMIPGFAYVPPGAGPFPVVIYIHGGPESQFQPAYNSLVQMWASELGVAVLAPNVRGSLGYGLGYLSLDDGRRREDAVRDIGALLDTIERTPVLDSSRVAVFGASYGGYMALASAVHYSDRLVAAIDRAGISNFVTYLENTQDYRRDLRRGEYGDERDPEMRAFLESISPLNNVERISVPLLIVQGQNDPVVPVSESQQMVDALRRRGQTVWYMNALNEGHTYEKKENEDVYQQVTYLFLQRYLLGR